MCIGTVCEQQNRSSRQYCCPIMCNLIIHSSHTSICIHLLPDKFPISFQLMKPNSNKRGNMHEVEMGLLNHSIGQMGSEENGTSTTTTMENENCLFPQVREIDSK